MSHSIRPTLPPLHTLDLPRSNVQLPSIHELFNDLDELPCQATSQPLQISSRSSLPDACLRPCTNTASTPTSTSTQPLLRFRLVLTSFENADAAMVVAPSPDPNIPPRQPFLLVGPALQKLRQGQCKLEKGTRVHPYRIVRHPSDRRSLTGSVDTNA